MAQTQTKQTHKPSQPEKKGPPAPNFLFKLLNPVLKGILNSPFHGRMSDRLMVISFNGRKSGKRYSTPVGYVRQGSDIFVFTLSPWRANFKTPHPVSMRIRGKDVSGTGSLVSDPARIKEMIRVLVAAHGDDLARRMGFYVENLETATPEAIQQATQGTYFIEIKTNSTP